jgi:hypothetical protein
MDVSANGSRVRLFRDVAAVTMDLNGLERLELNALGGADTITVNDLTGTDLKATAIDLAATGGGDAQPTPSLPTPRTRPTGSGSCAPGRRS